MEKEIFIHQNLEPKGLTNSLEVKVVLKDQKNSTVTNNMKNLEARVVR